ncbi:hypothetical protein [Anaerotignum sp. MB30-C6]|uniref:hypothetical protein n=1 Tax=Anaerotignum sp. MB30-C6 TaxID=3070814 RepID=UPI0027DE0ED3|nr:hypothetical protein [Anaerotignum sp. MB30-C6]WMI81856.1 hypothetical protein RBQ60_03765 [Anaerotignum sp. MB30-C6]WMI81956.1 hypothetical protein RBQ60_04280 [Anaerotignum sp. MB30-C6]
MNNRTRRRPKRKEFSKQIMAREMALLWIVTLGVLGLAFYSVKESFDASFPWLTAMVSLPWAAWSVSKTGYTMKSMKENTQGGIIYDSAMSEMEEKKAFVEDLRKGLENDVAG